jgi:hypothetical protein
LPAKSRCKPLTRNGVSKPTVWLHSPHKTAWGILHMFKRHQATLADVVIVDVNVPRAWVERTSAKGLWITTHIIPPARIVNIIDGDTYAASPIAANG